MHFKFFSYVLLLYVICHSILQVIYFALRQDFYFILLDSTPSLKEFRFFQFGWVRKLIENISNVNASSILFSYVCVITRFAFCINEFGMMMLL